MLNKVLKQLLLLTILVGCNVSQIEKGILQTTIYFATDLHLYSNELIGENNETYLKENFTSDGRVQEYDYELIDSLVNEVNNKQPNFLVLTGDLSYNGEKESLVELKNKLDTINKDTKVLVIPGNHDCYSINPFSCLKDNAVYMNGVNYEEFKNIFNEYGYNDAYSYDQDSLSYIYELNENEWILMLDTSISELNYEMNYNTVGGYLDESTIDWLENNLKYAKENGIKVISASHHNLLVHNDLFKDNYTLSNYETIISLFSNYDVRLNFSGHLHIQSIKSQKMNGNNVYDISSVSLLDYGNRYGKLDIYNNCYDYSSNKIDFIDDSIDFNKYSFNTFYQEYYDKSYYYNEYLYGEDAKDITDFLSKANAYYFDGDYLKINELKKNNKSLLKRIKKKTPDYDKGYIKTILEVENKNQHSLLIEK